MSPLFSGPGARGYREVMARSGEILRRALGLDYSSFRRGRLAFDYEALMASPGYGLERAAEIQAACHVGRTPLLELERMTQLVRSYAPPGCGARIFLKDEAANPSGSFKDRRAALSVHEAKERGYAGVIAATSGNYGAAVASQAAMQGLKCIIVQEVYDSRGEGQPEIVEKGRRCEAFGAEVVQLTVGPELFYVLLALLEETGYFSASLYTPYAILGIETLGYEVGVEVRARTGRDPDCVLVTHAGGGNVTGTARGLRRAGCRSTRVVGVSVDLSGLHMASDADFNRKSFTTGHTGFGVPFATWPDRSDVPINAARPLRYLDEYRVVTQGEVFYATEALAQLEGLERGPAGNTSLAAALDVARSLPRDAVVVVQETEYTGAGKHPYAQLTFARENGVDVRRGDPEEQVPGRSIVIPWEPSQIRARPLSLARLRASYLRNAVQRYGLKGVSREELEFLAEDCRADEGFVAETLKGMGVGVEG
ncbi:MAG: PLP-dependent lyase/thiolase [Acetobacteraceae bacterium]|nr:PLP-dependent lyase/thiolase [Acetobacteraceae bacterium]